GNLFLRLDGWSQHGAAVVVDQLVAIRLEPVVPQVNPRPNDFTYILDMDRNRRGSAARLAKCRLVKRDARPVSRVRHGLGADPIARTLEYEYSPWSQDAQEFLNILAAVSGSHVLKNADCLAKVK